MIMIFGTLVSNDDISRLSFHFLKILIFWVVGGVEGQKMAQIDKKFCLLLRISETIPHMSVVFGAHISSNFFHFFKILIFWVVRVVKGKKMAQNDKKFCLSHSISQEPYIL